MKIEDILIENRLRTDLGDIDELCNSIREHGLIEPIVISSVIEEHDSGPRLIAGERRLTALKRLGVTDLVHATHFIWNYELDPLKIKAMELEENIRRKELTWQEVVRGKQQLLEIMQQIHGTPTGGRPRAGTDGGFGVGKLAAMLGESVGQVSQDLQVASFLEKFPSIGKAENKSSALSQLKLLGTVATMTASSRVAATLKKSERSWKLFECDFRLIGPPLSKEDILNDESVDLIWTDLPYGGDVEDAHSKDEVSPHFDDSRRSLLSLLPSVAKESYRVLRQDRYAVFCFGFNYYTELVDELRMAGFNLSVVPTIWVKNTKFSANPLVSYCISYEPILVAWKGNARFIRAGQSNVITLPVPTSSMVGSSLDTKLHLVQKPVELVQRFLEDMTIPGALVVDWCAGTGTTGVAAHRCGRRSIMFEKDPKMALLARTRLEAL